MPRICGCWLNLTDNDKKRVLLLALSIQLLTEDGQAMAAIFSAVPCSNPQRTACFKVFRKELDKHEVQLVLDWTGDQPSYHLEPDGTLHYLHPMEDNEVPQYPLLPLPSPNLLHEAAMVYVTMNPNCTAGDVQTNVRARFVTFESTAASISPLPNMLIPLLAGFVAPPGFKGPCWKAHVPLLLNCQFSHRWTPSGDTTRWLWLQPKQRTS
jgi:hypothetical protein